MSSRWVRSAPWTPRFASCGRDSSQTASARHNIFVEKKHLALSVGTTAVHLAIQDLAGLGCLRAIDFGYGTPNNELRSSHILKTRAQVLLFDNTKSISLLLFMHRHFVAVSEGLVSTVKWIRKHVQAMRKVLPA